MTFGLSAGLAPVIDPCQPRTRRMANGGLTVPLTSFQEHEPCS